MLKKVLITGSQGFIGSYLCQEFLNNGYNVFGVDDYSKYGRLTRPQDKHPNFELFELDLTNYDDFGDLIHYTEEYKFDYIIANAAMIGGISYFHKYAYDLIDTNELINSNTFNIALRLHKQDILKKIIVMSSSMVYESVKRFPSKEEDIYNYPPPISTYGFQKLAAEYFCKGAYQQYGLPYNIVRPFNCVGVGEDKSLKDEEITDGNISFTMSHVLPDLVRKIHQGQNPVKILGTGQQIRTYTNGKDIARGVRTVLESTYENDTFNISSFEPTSVLDLAKKIWDKLRPGEEFKYELVPGFEYDVQMRVPDISKAKNLLGFEANITLDESIDEVISEIKKLDQPQDCGIL